MVKVSTLVPKRQNKNLGRKTKNRVNNESRDTKPILDTFRTIVDTPINIDSSDHPTRSERMWWARVINKRYSWAVSLSLWTYIKKYNNGRHSLKDEKKILRRYARAMYCAHELHQLGDKVTTRFCRAKWCSVCARNRQFKLLSGYIDELNTFKEPYSVVLSFSNVKAKDLGYALDLFSNTLTSIQKSVNHQLQKRGLKVRGCRSLEITYNQKEDTYHPHAHLYLDTKEVALNFQKKWMAKFPKSTYDSGNAIAYAGQVGNYVSPVNTEDKVNAVLEVIKYNVKPIDKGEPIPPHALHTIIEATHGRQMFGAYGLKKTKIETVTIETSNVDWRPPVYTLYNYKEDDGLYVDGDGEVFIHYRPEYEHKKRDIVNDIP